MDKKAREEKNRVGHCEKCWSTEHLICHHVIPLQWQNDMLEVDDFDKEVINVPTEVFAINAIKEWNEVAT